MFERNDVEGAAKLLRDLGGRPEAPLAVRCRHRPEQPAAAIEQCRRQRRDKLTEIPQKDTERGKKI